MMMKTANQFLTLGLAIFITSCGNRETKEQMTAQDYENASKHFASNMNTFVHNTLSRGVWDNDSTYVYQLENKDEVDFMVVHAGKAKKEKAFDKGKLAEALSYTLGDKVDKNDFPFSTISFPNDKAISFKIKGKIYLCDLDTYEITSEDVKGSKRNEYMAPNGRTVAYIDNYNLWIRDIITGKKTQLTFDGEKDYGYATNNAGWTKSDGPVLKWSPNSDKIATFKQDARGVKEMYLTSTNVGHPTLEAWKHPLPGDSTVFKLERVIIHLDNQPKIVPLQMASDFQRSTITDHVAARSGEFYDNDWKEDGSLLSFVSSSRDHKIAALKIADTKTGKVSPVLTEETKTYFESGVRKINWNVLYDSDEVIWFSERDNWGHLYLYDLTSGDLKNQITKGEWAVQQVLYTDTKNRIIYFTAGGKEPGNPYHKYLYKVNFDGSELTLLTPEKGDHSITFSSNYSYFVDEYSTTATAPVYELRDLTGKKIMTIEQEDISELKENGWQEPIEFTVKARDKETDLYGLLYLPSTYDEAKKYPVLNYIYPGPQSGSVGNYSFRVAKSDMQAVAELGFAVMAVDAMGTPGRSKSFHDAYYGNMGDNGLPDNITAIKQLAAQYKGMDTTRVGIWGHSGGGFASTDAILRYPDFYDVAVSGAGNHDNRNYEADWGEKWQGLLQQTSDSTTNYDNQANQLQAHNLKGKLLLAHGTMDNNVPPSNTLLMVDALIRANKDFDLLMIPNKRHGFGDMTNYMTRRRWDYFVKHLKGIEPPKEFLLEN